MEEYIDTFYHKLYTQFCEYGYNMTYEQFKNMDNDPTTSKILNDITNDIIHEFPILQKTYQHIQDDMLIKYPENINRKIRRLYTLIRFEIIYDYKDYFNILLRKEKLKKLRQ